MTSRCQITRRTDPTPVAVRSLALVAGDANVVKQNLNGIDGCLQLIGFVTDVG
jgi:hypothetical protein